MLYTFRNPYPTIGLIRLDVCDNAYEVIDTLAVDYSESLLERTLANQTHKVQVLLATDRLSYPS